MSRGPPPGDGHPARLREVQDARAAQVLLRDDFPVPPRTVAGFAAALEADGAHARAAAVLLDAATLELIDRQAVRVRTAPGEPGLSSARELPALLQVLGLLPQAPDLAFIDGHGTAHPHRFGVAAQFGVATGLPSIGVARHVLVGEARLALHEMRGAFTPLRHGTKQIGWLLRSKPGCLPLVVSPGHRVSLASAPELVMRVVRGDRLPEPIRLADRLASRPDPGSPESATPPSSGQS